MAQLKMTSPPDNMRDRLRYFLRTQGIKDNEVCAKMGKSPAWLSTMRETTSLINIRRFCELYPQASYEWLAFGRGDMVNTAYQNPNEAASRAAIPDDALAILQRQNIILQNSLERANQNIAQLNQTIAQLTELNAAQNNRFMAIIEKVLVK